MLQHSPLSATADTSSSMTPRRWTSIRPLLRIADAATRPPLRAAAGASSPCCMIKLHDEAPEETTDNQFEQAGVAARTEGHRQSAGEPIRPEGSNRGVWTPPGLSVAAL
jgi:hypothetical protein